MTTSPTIPFNDSLFFNAMCNLVGRVPDETPLAYHGRCRYLYEPRDEEEARKFARSVSSLRE